VLEEAGQTVDRLTLIGGGARSLTWAQILATALGKALVLGEDAHVGPAFGAARLARMAVTGSLGPDGTASTRLVAPDPSLKSRMQEKYARFRALYPALKASFASG
jgi:xylulokinase